MTKKDYILIAATIEDINQKKAKGVRIAELFADALRNTNPLFDRERFLKACGSIEPNN